MDVALAIIVNESKVLVGKIKAEKINEYGGLKYAFPSEHIKDSANMKEELASDVKKQTGLDIEIVKKIGERVHPFTKNKTNYFHCIVASKQRLKTSKDTDNETFIWVKTEKLSDYMPSLFNEVKEYLEKTVN